MKIKIFLIISVFAIIFSYEVRIIRNKQINTNIDRAFEVSVLLHNRYLLDRQYYEP